MDVGSRSRAARLALVAWAAMLLATAGTARAGDPSRIWKTIETEHFSVHYYEPLGDVARKAGVAAERAHRILAPVLDHAPEHTHIIVVDDVDSSNGFASVLPRNSITLFVSAPPDNSALADYDDWVYNLVVHEYTHIVHLDTISGIPAIYNRIFGKSWSPNQVQPRWIIEGLATYQESKRSSSGRTRHPLFDMYMRLATLVGNERRIDEISSGPRQWPHGNAAYLYGSHFLKFVFDRYGDDTAAFISKDYGGRAIPYALNRGIARATGRTFVELYEDWRRFRDSKYSLQMEAIERAGRREGRRLTFTGENNLNPHYTRDGRHLVWQRGDGYSLGQFRIMPVGGDVGQSETYAIIERSGAFDMLSDGSMLVEQTRIFRTEYSYQELHVWDKQTGRIEQLTHGKRLSDPSVSPDESQVAFVMNGAGRRQLAVMPIHREGQPRIVWTGPGRYDQAFSPDWSPDGRRIAFSAWRSGGYRDVLIVDVATGAVEEVTRDRAMDSEPEWSPDGNYLYFTSDRTGILNLYAWDSRSKALWQVTNVLGCVLAPAVSPDGSRLAYQGFAEYGYELFETDLDPSSWTPAVAYIDDRPDATVLRDDEVSVSEPRPYRAIETLAPRAYTLGLVANQQGQALQIETDGRDVAGHHAYTLATTIGLGDGGVNVGGRYSYRRLWPSLGVSVSRTITERGGYVVDGNNLRYTEEGFRGTAGLGFPILRDPDGSASLGLDYDFDYLRNLDGQLHQDDPNALVPRLPETDLIFAGVALRWSYSDTRGFTYTVGPQDGKDLALSARLDHPTLGSDTTSLTLSYRGTLYHQIPIATHPSIMLRLSGGLRTTDRERVGQFAVGGAPDSQDIVRALQDNLRVSGTGYLRGYESRAAAGAQFHLANIEVRQELYEFERGIQTLPAFVRRLHGALLFDAGNAFDGPFDAGDLKAGLGGALRVDFTLGFGEPWTLDVGYAHGLTEGAIGETWLLLTGTL